MRASGLVRSQALGRVITRAAFIGSPAGVGDAAATGCPNLVLRALRCEVVLGSIYPVDVIEGSESDIAPVTKKSTNSASCVVVVDVEFCLLVADPAGVELLFKHALVVILSDPVLGAKSSVPLVAGSVAQSVLQVRGGTSTSAHPVAHDETNWATTDRSRAGI